MRAPRFPAAPDDDHRRKAMRAVSHLELLLGNILVARDAVARVFPEGTENERLMAEIDGAAEAIIKVSDRVDRELSVMPPNYEGV